MCVFFFIHSTFPAVPVGCFLITGFIVQMYLVQLKRRIFIDYLALSVGQYTVECNFSLLYTAVLFV